MVAMVEKKSFFTENNSLNKGYKSDKRRIQNSDSFNNSSILNSYKDMSPEALQKVMQMAAKEQEHRHNMDIIHLKIQKTAIRMGRLFAVFSVIAVCYTSLALAANNMQQEAMIFALIGFLAITISSFAARGNKSSYSFSKNISSNEKVAKHRSRDSANSNQTQSQSQPQSEAQSHSGPKSSQYKGHYRSRKRA